MCNQCEEEHRIDEMELAFLRPDAVIALSQEDREGLVQENNDLAIIGGKQFFIRALLPLPVLGRKEVFHIGIWVKIEQLNFERVYELWDDPLQSSEPPFSVTIANDIPGLLATCGLHAILSLTDPANRPKVTLIASNHPLACEQSRGITAHRAYEYSVGALTPLPVIETIRCAAAECQSRYLNEPVYLDRMLYLDCFNSPTERFEGFIDVPVSSVVALGRGDLAVEGDSWRDVVDKRLTGEGWTEHVIEYFEGELREKPFPARTSLYELRLHCTGGICVVGNGNHRLAGAKAWLLSKQGDAALLLKAKVTYRPLADNVRILLTEALQSGRPIKLSIATGYRNIEHFFLIGDEYDGQLFACHDGEISDLKAEPRWKRRLRRLFKRPSVVGHEWVELPVHILTRMLDSSWIDEQLNPK
nr:DUF2199 domain-containing protein [Pseudomonas yamanorum]